MWKFQKFLTLGKAAVQINIKNLKNSGSTEKNRAVTA